MSRIEQLKAQREELDKKIRELSAKDAKEKRALETRQKTIIGAWVLQHRPELVANIIANLTREQDKAAFANFKAPKADAPRLAATAAAQPQPKQAAAA